MTAVRTSYIENVPLVPVSPVPAFPKGTPMALSKASTVLILQSAFGTLLGLGSVLLICGVLLTQVPGKNHAFGILVLSIAGLFLTVSLVLGMFRDVGHWFLTIIVSGELVVCAYGLWSLLT